MLKVLTLDIETSPMEALVWGRKDVNISLNQIKTDWSILAWSAKWLGKSKVYYYDTSENEDVRNDFQILCSLWRMLEDADIVITQNGTSFDMRKINARFIAHGFNPPSSYRQIDTYRLAKRIGDFTSHSLEYLTEKLKVKHKKLSHSKFPGMSLWTECLKGNKAAWQEMKRYNINDTLGTEELYLKLRAWAPESGPKPFESKDVTLQCGTCGYKGVMTRWGYYRTNKGKWQRWSCQECGSFAKGEKCK
jgi:DNA polymerase elongation subunit (family B)